MARSIATTTTVDRDGLLAFLRPRHRVVLLTPRSDGSWQGSPVTAGVDAEGRIVEFKVLVRPLKAIQLVHQRMAAMLESAR